MLVFSFLRNGIQMGFLPRGQRTAINRENNDKTILPEQRISQHLSVINGLKGLSVVLATWGITFYFVWFSIISNPEDVDNMTKTIFFNIVSGCVYVVPVFFYCSGFLQTFSLLQANNKGDMFTPINLGKWYLRKILRYIPLNIMAILGLLYLVPIIGSGPIWNKFKTATQGCDTYWWTNIIWINNLYPRNFDDKCLPWTWFVPCYIQMSLIVPAFVLIYKNIENKCFVGLIFAGITILVLTSLFVFVYLKDLGGTMVRNDNFYNTIFMNPLMHLPTFLLGIFSGLIYYRYRKERGYASAIRNSFTSRALEMIRHNTAPRYIMYLLALCLCASTVLW